MPEISDKKYSDIT